jgi:hypothetical protein
MKSWLYTVRQWHVIKWSCCDNSWELILSKQFTDRYKYAPVCPKCKEKGKTFNELYRRL